jgi:hypothetical protein
MYDGAYSEYEPAMTLIAESSQTPYAVNKTKRSFDSGIAIRSVTGVEHVVTARST